MRQFRLSAGLAVAAGCALVVGSLFAARPVFAFSIELQDAAPLRIEQQRDAALGRLPLAGTPDLARRDERLKQAGLTPGDPVFIRVFKAEAELEVWMQKGDAFVLFATYPICFWSGTLGPKLVEGDNQTPEGFYTVTRRQLHRSGRHPRSLNLGFPNAFDRANERTGSYILVHGACSSVGCYAMTDPVAEEVFGLAERALYKGQDRVHVHAFPFRMTDDNLARHATSPWASFWQGLKPAYDAFEATRLPPIIGVCGKGYAVANGVRDDEGDPGPLGVVRTAARAAAARLACEPSAPASALVADSNGAGDVTPNRRLKAQGATLARVQARIARRASRRANLTAAVENGDIAAAVFKTP